MGFFTANKARVLPILRNELKNEMARAQVSDLFLLDVGFFVYRNDDAAGKAVALDALLRLNPASAEVSANDKELFEFVHAVAQS